MAANSVHFTRPLSTAELSAQAADFPYDAEVPLRYWLRTADAIQKQAQYYERDGDDQHAYLLYMRYVLLFLEKLPSHPDTKQPANKKLVAAANKLVSADLQKLEALKPGLNQRAQRYAEALARRREAKEAAATANQSNGDIAGDLEQLSLGHRRNSSTGQKRTLEAKEHTDVAAKLARREWRRRKVRGDDGDSEKRWSFKRRSRHEDGDDLSKQLIEAGRRGQVAVNERQGSVNGTKAVTAGRPMEYPSVPGKSSMAAWDEMKMPPKPAYPTASRPIPQGHSHNPLIAPSVPPKQYSYGESPPRVPAKVAAGSGGTTPPTRSSTSTPDINPREFTFKPSAFLESGTPLRTVFLPPTLRSTFLKIASPNTALGQESLGILCGTLISNAFFITRLVLPPQTSTSDTCEMTSEGEIALWSHCDTHDLLTLGWIHTHPTQTCFMSSRDLHTHSGYQAQMAESVAIVCAPKHEPTWGAFRLTDPPGLPHVLGCKQTGIFHPHSENNLYTDAMKPGHVCELPGLEFEVVDLR